GVAPRRGDDAGAWARRGPAPGALDRFPAALARWSPGHRTRRARRALLPDRARADRHRPRAGLGRAARGPHARRADVGGARGLRPATVRAGQHRTLTPRESLGPVTLGPVPSRSEPIRRARPADHRPTGTRA